MLTALEKNTKKVQNVVSTSEGLLCVEPTQKYLNLGEVISGNVGGVGYQVAAGAYVYSNAFTNLEWVRNFVFLTKSDSGATYTANICRLSGDGSIQAADNSFANLTGYGVWISGSSLTATGAPGLIGYGAKFSMKNTGASAINVWFSIQLMG